MKILFLGNQKSILAVERFNLIKNTLNPKFIRFFHTTADSNTVISRFFLYIYRFFYLILIIYHHKITHIHYHGAYHFIFNFISCLNVKVIITPQGSDINQNISKKRVFYIVKFLFLNADCITVKSLQMKKKVESILKHKHIVKLNWGISDEFFNHDDKLLSNPKKIKILSMRASGKIYNINLIFDTIFRLKQKHDNIEFNYIEYNKDDNIILDLSLCDNIYKELSKNDIKKELSKNDFIISIPSFDGFSTTIMESLAVGCYPIISDIDSYDNEFIPELLTKVKLDIKDDLIDSLSILIENIDQIRSQNEYRIAYAKEEYSMRKQVNILKKIYSMNTKIGEL